ncbi:phosphate ABC transporter substrate-binding protein PstS [Corynebacterium frankenforstense]|uniref:phosphate ABC transporter substrate-binding protein PstS n=1 Tax=Corynebacterium frankenforstense TaxID=1230998 RepID=UPI0025511844|nr:phosphate ABC transporter substrate-binding protein PstS [Corynebacterium frankenforstense]MDK6260727.1 phosphate ABC transporter substrate-binding protein PstS [Corynebacterium frankenforstense]
MMKNFKRSAAVLGVVATASVALAACSEGGEGGELIGEGASSQQNAMDYFGTKFSETGSSLAYNASGSGSGRQNFIGGQADFAGSDSPLKEEQVDPAKDRCGGADAWHLPFVIGPVAIGYNLDGVDNLNLSVENVAKIFKGEITNWNDPAIAADNEGTELPDQDITVVYRSDESGTSDNFQKFLKAAAPDIWETDGQQFPTAVGSGANGSNGVATEVNNTAGAITYVEAGFVHQNENVEVANIDFGHGPVELGNESVTKALDNLTFETEGNDMVVDSDALFAMDTEGAYPLVLTTYEIVCSDYSGTDKPETAETLKSFLNLALDHQDDELADRGYIPVTGEHADRLETAVEAIK